MLDIAVGVFLALLAMRLVDHALVLHRDSRRVRMLSGELEGAAESFIDKMHAEMKAEEEAEAVKKARRRKPATKKAPAKSKSVQRREAVMKKGATNAKSSTRR